MKHQTTLCSWHLLQTTYTPYVQYIQYIRALQHNTTHNISDKMSMLLNKLEIILEMRVAWIDEHASIISLDVCVFKCFVSTIIEKPFTSENLLINFSYVITFNMKCEALIYNINRMWMCTYVYFYDFSEIFILMMYLATLKN